MNSFVRYMFLGRADPKPAPRLLWTQRGDIADAYIRENGGREPAFKLIAELQEMAGIAPKKEKRMAKKNAKNAAGQSLKEQMEDLLKNGHSLRRFRRMNSGI